jgi:hypothetical protein
MFWTSSAIGGQPRQVETDWVSKPTVDSDGRQTDRVFSDQSDTRISKSTRGRLM